MSDEDRDVDIESDEDDENGSNATQFMTQAEKRAHHNALERKRRDHIKESFHSLRDSVPSLSGEKQASRAQILKQATDYIQAMSKKNNIHQHDIDDLKKQNGHLEQQVRALERAKAAGKFIALQSGDGSSNSSSSQGGGAYNARSDSEESSASETEEQHVPRRKKLKT